MHVARCPVLCVRVCVGVCYSGIVRVEIDYLQPCISRASWPVLRAGRTRIRLKTTGELFSLVPPTSKANNVIIGRWAGALGGGVGWG